MERAGVKATIDRGETEAAAIVARAREYFMMMTRVKSMFSVM